MHLSGPQIEEFHRKGFLLFPGLLDEEEAAVLKSGLPALESRDGPEVVREKEGNTIRLIYGGHKLCDPFARLSVMPRILNPVRQLLGEDAYMHQSRLNPKPGFSGGAWNWHQDFGTWHREDGVPEPRCVMTAIFLDDASAVNAPLMVLPGSQHHGMVEDVTAEEVTGYALMQIDESVVERYAAENGIVPLMGPAGTVAFIHCNLVHGSANNVSPYPRAIMYFNYNACSNIPTGGKGRAWFHNNQDRSPLEPGDDDALHVLARAAE
ncbi:MAG: phytanoyl-CoA dioxygenase family protein [Alphaproteobacteria bacterium]